jgi:phage tail P2-like protein
MIKLADARLTDGLPDVLQKEPWVQALSEAIHSVTAQGINYVNSARTYSRLGELVGQILDFLGVENRAPHYRQDFSDDVKRTIIQNSMVYFAHAGTKAAVEDLIQDIYGGAKVVEWFDYNGEPGHYRVELDISSLKSGVLLITTADFEAAIAIVVRESSHLDGVYLVFRRGISVSERFTAYRVKPPACGTLFCGTYPSAAAVGKEVPRTILMAPDADGYLVSPDKCGTEPGISEIGGVSTAAIGMETSLQAYAPAVPLCGLFYCGQQNQ